MGAWLPRFQPYLMAASIIALAFGFFSAYRRGACRARRRVAGRALLWISLILVTMTVLFPQVVASILADAIPGGAH